LVTAAVDDWAELYTFAYGQGANTLRPIKLMTGKREQINVVLGDIHRRLGDALRGISVKKHPTLAAQLTDLGNRLQDADFIVGVHHADQDRLFGESQTELFQINQAVLLHRQIRHLQAAFLKMLATVEDSLVLSDNRDDVITF